jgi:hypothetical protein
VTVGCVLCFLFLYIVLLCSGYYSLYYMGDFLLVCVNVRYSKGTYACISSMWQSYRSVTMFSVFFMWYV